MKPVLVASALVLLVTGCGGGSSTGSTSKSAYIAKAEAICATANTEQKALTRPTSIDGLAPYVGRVVAIADEATTKLQALEVPASDAAELQKRVLGPLQEQLSAGHTYADEVAAAAKAKDSTVLVKLLSDPPTKTRADLPWMKDYGFDECVKAADTSG